MSAAKLERITLVRDDMVVRAERHLARAGADFTDAMLSCAAGRRELDGARQQEPCR